MIQQFTKENMKVRNELESVRGKINNLAKYGVIDVPIFAINAIPEEFTKFQKSDDT
jgi:hypothetical protein